VGRNGGYRLARDPASITLLEVIEAAEGDARRRTCVLKGIDCSTSESGCDVHAVFAAGQAALLAELGGTTLARVLAESARATPQVRATDPSRELAGAGDRTGGRRRRPAPGRSAPGGG